MQSQNIYAFLGDFWFVSTKILFIHFNKETCIAADRVKIRTKH